MTNIELLNFYKKVVEQGTAEIKSWGPAKNNTEIENRKTFLSHIQNCIKIVENLENNI